MSGARTNGSMSLTISIDYVRSRRAFGGVEDILPGLNGARCLRNDDVTAPRNDDVTARSQRVIVMPPGALAWMSGSISTQVLPGARSTAWPFALVKVNLLS